MNNSPSRSIFLAALFAACGLAASAAAAAPAGCHCWLAQQCSAARAIILALIASNFAPACGFAQTVTPKILRQTENDEKLGIRVPPDAKLARELKPTGPARFEPEIAAFEKWDRQNAPPRAPILFVGSSTIKLWQTADAFPGLPVINRGFGGSTIADVNHFADRIVFKYKPRAIVFYSGDNDIASGKSAQQVYDDFLAFVLLVNDRLPKTRIYFITIKPSIARQKMWPEMKKANSLVQALTRINGQVTFIDTATPMLGPKYQGREASPKKDLFRDDGLHMNDKGYAMWNKTLAPLLQSAVHAP